MGARKQFLVVIACLFSVLSLNQANSEVITGQLNYRDIPLDGVIVTFFDSVNAELVGNVTTRDDGSFQTDLKPGSYKIHYFWINENKESCLEEFYNSDVNGENVFDLGTPVDIVKGQDKNLGKINIFVEDKPYSCGPAACIPSGGTLKVSVLDSSTGLGVPGILVQFKDSITAFPLFEGEIDYQKLKFTDERGVYQLIVRDTCSGVFDVKIRLSDPNNGIYSPEYYGTTDLDDFSAGEAVNFEGQVLEVSDRIEKVPPAQQVGNIIEDILEVLPPQDAQSIVSSLSQGQALLQDSNPNNDKGACGVLTGTADKLQAEVSKGNLTQEDADSLIAFVNNTKTALGCKN